MTDILNSIGAALPDYEVQRELGRGAMGVVYLGRHRRLGREVAIKEIAGPLADDPEVRSRFLTEARVLAALDHPNIVPVYDYVEEAGRCLLIMEALGGGTVWERFQRDGLTLPTTCALLLSACAAVEHAHRNGVLHRDLKPENLMLSTTGDLKVTDFGIAKVLDGGRTLATVEGSVLGTPAYMAPEQAEGAEVGPPADVYALGTMLYEMLSGRLPFEGDAPMALLVARLTADPPPLAEVAPSVPTPVCEVVDRAIARSVDERIPRADALARDLHQAVSDALGTGWIDQRDLAVGGSSVSAPTLAPSPQASSATPAPAPATVAPGSEDLPPTAPATIAPATATPASDASAPAAPATPEAEGGEGDADAPPPTPPPAAAPATIAPSAEALVRPSATGHPAGFDHNLRRSDLVGIEAVVRPTVPLRAPAVTTLIALAAAIALLLAGPSDPTTTLGDLRGLTLNGQVVDDGALSEIDLREPLLVTGLPLDTTDVELDLVVAGVPVAAATGAATDGTSLLDVGARGWLVGGTAEADLAVEGASRRRAATFAIATDRAWWASGMGAGALLLAAFALAGAESQSRRHQRGQVRTTSAIATAAGLGVAFACATLALALATGRVVTPAALLPPALAAAVAGAGLTVVRARLARRRRIRWRRTP